MTKEKPTMRILIIDDNPDDRKLELREVYALFPDAQMLEITNADEFEAAVAAGPPDLVLTDLDLRWTNGRQVLLTVKGKYPACPVVMFTGTGDETIAVELMKEGLDDYVVKSPRQLPRLRTSLKIAVEMAKSRADLSDREAHLARALAQQQVVVRELHHRVKNNLQTVTSLLHLRGRTVDAATRVHFDEIAGRMEALGAVQARIYQSAEFDRVDFCATLEDIAASLVKVYHGGQVSLITNFKVRFVLEVARAMPLSLICYEVIFPGRVTGPERPAWLLNVTNDAWFGFSAGPFQHLAAARLRAVEEGLPIVRATTTGISAVIDAEGWVVAALPLDKAGFIATRLPAAKPPTFFARHGNSIPLGLALLLAIAAIAPRFRRR